MQMTFLDWFENHFGEELSSKTARAFLDMSPTYAAGLNESYNQHIEEYGNFKIPGRQRDKRRPLLWGEVHDHLNHLFPPRVHDTKHACLSYDGIVVVDNFKLALEGMAGKDMGTAYMWYCGMLHWLTHHRPLVHSGVVSLTSEQHAYRVAPMGRFDSAVDREYEALIRSLSVDRVGRDLGAARALKYMKLVDSLDCEILSDEANRPALARVLAKWEIESVEDAALTSKTWEFNFDFARIAPADIVNVRKNDDVLADLRIGLAEAGTLADRNDRNEKLDDLFDRLNARTGNARRDAATTIGLSGLAFTVDAILAGLGTIGTTAYGLASGQAKANKEEAKAAATAIAHYLEPSRADLDRSIASHKAEISTWIDQVKAR